MPAIQCTATNAAGYQCKNKAMGDSEYCNIHHPDRKEAVIASFVSANKALRDKRKLDKELTIGSADDILRIQARVLTKLARKSHLSTKELSAFSTISNSYIRLMKESEGFATLKSLEEKVKSLGK